MGEFDKNLVPVERSVTYSQSCVLGSDFFITIPSNHNDSNVYEINIPGSTGNFSEMHLEKKDDGSIIFKIVGDIEFRELSELLSSACRLKMTQ